MISFLTSTKTSKPPWKNFLSVKTDMQLAPPDWYDFAIAIGSKSFLITPLLGLAFLISAIIDILLLFKLSSIFFLKLI